MILYLKWFFFWQIKTLSEGEKANPLSQMTKSDGTFLSTITNLN